MSGLTLYQLTDAYLQALDNLPEDVDQQTVNDTLECLQGAIEEKAFNIVAFARSLEGQAEVIAAEEKRLQQRRKALENRAVSLKTYLQGKMEALGMDKVKTDLFNIQLQNNPPSVHIVDEKQIPSKYVTVKTEYVINKKDIADAIKAGEVIPGAQLTQGRRLAIR